MYKFEISIRVRYGETDKMGYVYNGNYATYFEVGRVETLRKLGIPYRNIEDSGYALPVRDLQIRYFKPGFYDDELKIVTILSKMPDVRMRFDYEIYNPKGELITKGHTTLVFVKQSTGKPCQPPQNVIDALQPYFSWGP